MYGTALQHILQVGCDDVAMKKARTAGLFHAESGDLGGIVQPGGPVSSLGILLSYIQLDVVHELVHVNFKVYGLAHSNGGLITFAGGVPLKDGQGKIIGSIGVGIKF